MLRVALAAFALLCLTTPALAQSDALSQFSTYNEIAAETYRTELPGPRPDEMRPVYFWLPPNTHELPVPVIYVADGVSGLEMVVSGIRRPILEGRMQPILVFAMEASRQHRTQEYALGQRRNPYWQRHADWFVDTVMPWAEANAGASTDPAQRGLGGYSNGADWAIALAIRRPDLFSHVLAHSPVNEVRTAIPASLQGRWVISAGQQEGGGDIASLNNRIARHLGERATRQCIGPWGHTGASWLQVSPGSVAWLYQLGDPAAIQSPTEHHHCRTLRDQ
jgi:hypothetical protein